MMPSISDSEMGLDLASDGGALAIPLSGNAQKVLDLLRLGLELTPMDAPPELYLPMGKKVFHASELIDDFFKTIPKDDQATLPSL